MICDESRRNTSLKRLLRRWNKDTLLYVSTETTGRALGLYGEAQFYNIPFPPDMNLFFSGGLDIDMSTLNLKAVRMYDGDGVSPGDQTLASATSK